jgi:hypothetical protein
MHVTNDQGDERRCPRRGCLFIKALHQNLSGHAAGQPRTVLVKYSAEGRKTAGLSDNSARGFTERLSVAG